MNLITITDEILESASIEESDKENFKKARQQKNSINLKSFVNQMYIKKLSTEGLAFLFEVARVQSFKSGETITLARSVNILNDCILVNSNEFIDGFKAAIDELNKVYLKSLE